MQCTGNEDLEKEIQKYTILFNFSHCLSTLNYMYH